MDLKTYLKKYTSMDKSLIDGFYELKKAANKSEDGLTVDLDEVAKWLETQKSTLKKSLVKSYTKDVDYIIKDEKNKDGRVVETILLTPSCFKMVCMTSRTKRGEDARTYFIELEKHINKNKDYIIRDLVSQIAKVEPGVVLDLAPQVSNKHSKTLKHKSTTKKSGKTQKKSDS